jgi:hypothetical protein
VSAGARHASGARDHALGAPFTRSGLQEPQDFAEGQPVHLTVSNEDCISACVRNVLTSCTVTMSGGNITVESILAWDEPSSAACIAVCGRVEAACASEPLGAGSYVFEHGHQVRRLTVPSTGVLPCEP